MTPVHSPAREESTAIFLQREMQDIVTKETGLQPEFAAMLATAIVRGLRKRSGGQRIYIPCESKNEDRDAQIRREYDGTNRDAFCRKWGISVSRLYQIVAPRSHT